MGSNSFPFIPTAEIYTGNPATVDDPYTTGFTGYPWPNGARVQPGAALYWFNGTTNSWGKYRYVRLSGTAAVTLIAGGPVYWVGAPFTTVTPTPSEAKGGLNGIAGAILNASLVNGDWGFIQVAGYNASLVSAASVTGGDIVIGNATAMTATRVANGTAAPVQKVFYTAYSAVSGTLSAGVIQVEDIGGA